MTNTSIVICGEKYDIGCKVVLWNDPEGFNAYDTSTNEYFVRQGGKKKKVVVSGRRYSSRGLIKRKPGLAALQKKITQLFLHHTGMYRSKDTFNVLHRQRRLSVHFILDDDGTLYQTMDLREKAWHGGKNNPMSIGVEIDSRASADRFPNGYDEASQKKRGVGPRRITPDHIQNDWLRGFDYSDGQYEALIRLTQTLTYVFPKINCDFPRTSDGRIAKKTIKGPKKHCGLICHFHTKGTKIDPISFDFWRLLRGVEHGNPKEETSFYFNLSSCKGRQKALTHFGYEPGPIDGKFGSKTMSATKAFQADNGLSPDGRWGVKTEYTMLMNLVE